MKAFAVAVVAALALFACACGTDEEAERERAEAEEQIAELTEELEGLRAKLEESEDCSAAFTDFSEALDEIKAKLRVGLSFDDYSSSVQEASIRYERIDFDGLADMEEVGLDCLGGVGMAFEKAFNNYVKVEEIWGDCIDDFACDLDSIDPRMQRLWKQASTKIDEAESEMADLVSDAEQELERAEGKLEEAESVLAEHSE